MAFRRNDPFRIKLRGIRRKVEVPLRVEGNPDEAPTIYHYTDPKGLIGILSDGQLWATDIRYLNDSSELRYAESLHKSFLKELVSSEPSDATRNRLAQAALARSSTLQDMIDTYVVCFSAVNELLTQWNTYAAGGSGFSVGFDRQQIIAAIKPAPPTKASTWDQLEIPPNLRLVKVVYSEAEQKREFMRVFDALHDGALTSSSPPEQINQCAREMVDIAANSAGYFKHPCFEPEQELRIVVTTLVGCSKVQFRSSERTVVPFLKLPSKKQGLLPIKSVTIGPTLHQELSERSVKALLLANGYKRAYCDGVNLSTLPLALT